MGDRLMLGQAVALETERQAGGRKARMAAFRELTKPRISAMVLLSIVAAAIVAGGGTPGVWPVVSVAVGMLLVAASGNAANMYLERYTDFLMPRTARRPLPDQRLKAGEVATFAAVTLGAGLGFLLATSRPAVLIVSACTWLLYVLVYTPLKARTSWNTEVGAIAGALPVLTGSLAGTEQLAVADWSFFALLVCWQFPHFMAIAWLYREDYREAGLQMVTVTEPTGRVAGIKAVVWGGLTLLASLGPVWTFRTGWLPWLFAFLTVVLGVWYWRAAAAFARDRERSTARRLLKVSVMYLPAWMILLVLLSILVPRS